MRNTHAIISFNASYEVNNMKQLITFLGVFSGLCIVGFFVMLYGLQQGWDFSPYAVNKPIASEQTEKHNEAPLLTPTSTTSVPRVTSTTTSPRTLSQKKLAPIPVKKSGASSINKPIIAKPIVTSPTPLLVEKSVPQSQSSSTIISSTDTGNPSIDGVLNQKRILEIVNIERTKENLSALAFNTRLSAIAEGKAVDMINKQYFAHVSPDGTDVAKLAEIYGYKYVYLGENLAMGDFVSSSDVMNGWMNSPGHRANILNKNYSEVGISAIQGNYQGRVVWYAVQEFGRPLSSCPAPNPSLEAKIATEEGTMSTSEQIISTLRAEIDQSNPSESSYNAKVEHYNMLIDEYNSLVATTKADITSYNDSVSAFNICIGVEPKP